MSKKSSASKKDTPFSMGKSWFQNGRISHGNSLQGDSYFKSSGKFDHVEKVCFLHITIFVMQILIICIMTSSILAMVDQLIPETG